MVQEEPDKPTINEKGRPLGAVGFYTTVEWHEP